MYRPRTSGPSARPDRESPTVTDPQSLVHDPDQQGVVYVIGAQDSSIAELAMAAPRVYTCEEGAARIGSKVIRASTLARLARQRKVPHVRNGRKVGWTDDQLAGVVEYLTVEGAESKVRVAPAARRTVAPPATPGVVQPLESRPGRRYGKGVG